ncbi:hypothetical protein ACK32R_04295 [Aeromonas dhakensis]|jgi:hypothetical protein|uniref:hypothetical protein n=1 Tax=Aeromonas dhakensis TaxID=196024 RepID=UPI003985C5F2
MTLSEYIKKHYKIAFSVIAIFIACLFFIIYFQFKVVSLTTDALVFRSDGFKNAYFKAMYHVDFENRAEQGVWRYVSPSERGSVLLALKGDVFRVVLKRRGEGGSETVLYDVSGRYEINGGALYFFEPGVSKIFNGQAVILIPGGKGTVEMFCDGQPSLIFNKMKSF